jgi:eukaryotic-like serine/threonine-protein kinase
MQPVAKTIEDRYEVLAEIGKGGMATVTKARQLSLGRIVAIKEIKPAYANNPELVERFKREARIAAALVHENIVQVYNFGATRPGELFIVMEFVDGQDLRTLLKNSGALPPRLAAIAVRNVARGLAYAHARGLVHRDVKPANIMITTLGEVKLMDFGIVRERDSELTRTGAFLGTPNYMAPEQFLGEEITPATDIFSLGVVLYEILTGAKPFKADNEGTLAKKVRTQKEAKVRSLNSEVPRRLAAVVHQCLAKDPHRRPEGGYELVRQLDRVIGPGNREDQRQELSAWLLDTVRAMEIKHQYGGISIKGAAAPAIPDEDLDPISPQSDEPRPSPSLGIRPVPRKPLQDELEFKEDSIDLDEVQLPPPARKSREPLEARPAPSDIGARVPPPAPPRKTSARRLAPAPAPEPDPGPDDSDSVVRPGEFIIKWLWRMILLAIAVLAGLIVFLLYVPADNDSGFKDRSLIERLLQKHQAEPPPSEPSGP